MMRNYEKIRMKIMTRIEDDLKMMPNEKLI
jgi:hypothetical protein